MDEAKRAGIEADCLRLCRLFFVLSDRGEAEGYANLYIEDGTFERPGLSVRGREQVAAAIRARPAHLVMRHLGITALIDVISEDEAKGMGSHMLLMYDRLTGRAEPPQVGDFVDSYVRTEQGWRIASRVVNSAFSS
ncbi:nuclear transport factor 2 family protein [Sphingobium sp. MK2]|uniref:nuclear transport factor 2 family protein n=1 Tax=Sphingobium sp. MK2 TaxID=3116540 RepID=UPI0032E363BF